MLSWCECEKLHYRYPFEGMMKAREVIRSQWAGGTKSGDAENINCNQVKRMLIREEVAHIALV